MILDFNTIKGSILFYLLVIFLAIILLSFYFINQQENDAISINVAGRQRMLSQKLTKGILLYILTQDEKLLRDINYSKGLFLESLEALINGGNIQQDLNKNTYNKIPPASGNTLSILEEAKEEWSNFEKYSILVLNNPDNLESLQGMNNASINLLNKMDQVTYTLQKNSESKINIMLKIQVITLILAFIIAVRLLVYAYHKKVDEKLKYLTFHDQLTGLYNRAFFEEELKRLDTQRFLPISIIMGDVNGLKVTNDAFGHLAGDKLLQKVANTLRDVCRQEDIISRWGGDEFVILLPRTSLSEGQIIVERIKKKFSKLRADPIKPSIALGYATKVEKAVDILKVLQTAEERMYRNKMVESKSARSSIIFSLEKALLEKNYETKGHIKRVKTLSRNLGKAIGLPDNDLVDLALLAVLHDIGKVSLPDNVLLKPGPLTDDEWKVIKKHPEIGYRIALTSDELVPIAENILAHHERWDGKGYPRGLKGEEIPLLARLLAIVDAYDIMTHERPYKKAVSKEEAIKELKKGAGKQFDGKLVKEFIEKVLSINSKNLQR